jgi:hypothetical protein
MAPMSDELVRKRARIAALSRDRAEDDPELVTARRDYWAERLHDRVAEIVSKAPDFSDEQLERVAALLRSGRPATGGAATDGPGR